MSKRSSYILMGSMLVALLAINIYYFHFRQVTLNFYSHPDKEHVIADLIKEYESSHPNIKINLIELPDNTDQKLEMITSKLAARDGSVDIVDSDVTWPAIFVKSGLVEELGTYVSVDEKKAFLKSALSSAIVNGKLYGLPYRIDTAFLFYRKDLLSKYDIPVPRTWNDVIKASKTIESKHPEIKGYAGSWKQFEGLTCNFFEIAHSRGLKLYDENSEFISSPEQIESVISFMHDMIYKYNVSPRQSIAFSSSELRDMFVSGKLVFMRDWAAGWKYSQSKESSVYGKVGIAPLPNITASNESSAAFGGWLYMISSSSVHKSESIEFIKYMSSREVQLKNIESFNYLPSDKSLYHDETLAESMPFISEYESYIDDANPRPRKSDYDLISHYT